MQGFSADNIFFIYHIFLYCIFTICIHFTVVSSMKKKIPVSKKTDGASVDAVRKSLEVDVEFQQSKVKALLEKIKSLG